MVSGDLATTVELLERYLQFARKFSSDVQLYAVQNILEVTRANKKILFCSPVLMHTELDHLVSNNQLSDALTFSREACACIPSASAVIVSAEFGQKQDSFTRKRSFLSIYRARLSLEFEHAIEQHDLSAFMSAIEEIMGETDPVIAKEIWVEVFDLVQCLNEEEILSQLFNRLSEKIIRSIPQSPEFIALSQVYIQ